MQTVKIRQEGDVMIVTIPRDYAAAAGWAVGTEITIKRQGSELTLAPVTRQSRSAFIVDELLGQIDPGEIEVLNDAVKEFSGAEAVGKEYW